jgi:hypothetical protein
MIFYFWGMFRSRNKESGRVNFFSFTEEVKEETLN